MGSHGVASSSQISVTKVKSVIKVVIISVSSKAILKTVNKAVGVNSINIPTQLEITTYTCRVPGLSGKQTGKRQ